MNKYYVQQIFCWIILYFAYYSCASLFNAVLFSSSATATQKNTSLQIAQQLGTASENVSRAAAERASKEAFILFEQGTPQSLQQAVKKWLQALKLWREAGDKAGVATTLSSIGSAYSTLGNKQKALSYYTSALAVYQTIGDKVGEATILSNIIQIYADLDKLQPGLEYSTQIRH